MFFLSHYIFNVQLSTAFVVLGTLGAHGFCMAQ